MTRHLSPGKCAMSPHFVLEEAGLPYDTESVDRAQESHRHRRQGLGKASGHRNHEHCCEFGDCFPTEGV